MKNSIKKFIDLIEFFLIANKSDKTNWRKAIYKLYLFKDSFIKYPDEFIEAIITLLINMENSYLFSQNFQYQLITIT